MARFQLNILGCGSAKPTHRHSPSCQVIDFRDNLFMIDCGEGAQSMMRAMRLKFMRLNHIFISHLHGDHCFGLPGLISTMALQGKAGKLTIHIFKDGAEQFGNFFNYFLRDTPMNIEFNIIDTSHKVIYEDDSLRVWTIPLKHRVPSVGFLFEEKPKLRRIDGEMVKFHNIHNIYMDRLKAGEDYTTPDGVIIPNCHLTKDPDKSIKYAYCSDTRPAAKVIPIIQGVDWLYHESTFADDNKKRAKDTFHSTAREAAEVATKAGVKNLILGHYSSRYDDESGFLEEAQQLFKNTILSNEGMKIDFIK